MVKTEKVTVILLMDLLFFFYVVRLGSFQVCTQLLLKRGGKWVPIDATPSGAGIAH